MNKAKIKNMQYRKQEREDFDLINDAVDKPALSDCLINYYFN
jgi:hypothetical protein